MIILELGKETRLPTANRYATKKLQSYVMWIYYIQTSLLKFFRHEDKYNI